MAAHLSRPAMLMLLLLPGASGATAQGRGPDAAADSGLPSWADSFAVLAPGAHYAKSGLRAVISGHHYRDVWATPIRVPVLSLQRFAGGLTPVRAHAGHQTTSLRLVGADGREYQFRSVNKDPTALLAPEFQGTLYAKSLQDGVSASFPAAPLLANGLLEAAGVLVNPQTLAVMPDDPALGPFRSLFSRVLGILEQRESGEVDSVVGGRPRRAISPTKLFRLLDAGPDDRVDARAFLRARLMDMLLGDRDRHRDQFRWAAFGDARPTLWQPISRDHDEAFVQLDGLALDVVRWYFPPLPTFRSKFPGHVRLNWHSREIDRRFLVELDRAVWDSAAAALQGAITDEVIQAAVRRMPAEMYPVAGERLAGVLQGRRDGLRAEALGYYDYLAREVEIRGTDAAEEAEVTRVDGRQVDIVIRRRRESRPYFQRRFDDRETGEIRLKMWGGDDRVLLRGDSTPRIRLRIVGGDGDDVFVDSTRTGGVRLYDDRGRNTAEGLRRGTINAKHYAEWVGSDTNRYPPQEWGTWWRPLPWLEANSDVGLFVGAGVARTDYGFRRSPYASELRLRAGYSTAAQSGRADFLGDFHPENAAHFWRIHLRASGVDVLRYYGLGNDSRSLASGDFHRVSLQRYSVEPAFVLPIGRQGQVRVGPAVRWSRTGDNIGRFIAPLRDTLLGGSDFGELAGRITLELDTRERPLSRRSAFETPDQPVNLPRSGIHLSVAAEVDPAVWDVPSTFGSGQAEATAFVSASGPASPTLAFRAGGRRVWGSFPFFESAFIGGTATLPGYHSNRFAGDASLYGGVQLRLTLGRTFLALPARWGVFGNAGAGRVYVDGESPGGWHAGGGGGVWLSLLNHENTVSLAVDSGSEGTLLQSGVAFGF